MAALKLQLLGRFRLSHPTVGEIVLPTKKGQALLAYLALAPSQRRSRTELIALLWGDRGEEQGRHSLRQCVLALRKALGDDEGAVLRTDGEDLVLAKDAVEVDALDLEHLATAPGAASNHAVVGICSGELLEAINVNSEGFEEWLTRERVRWREIAVTTLTRLARTSAEAGNPIEALPAVQRALALDPLREDGHRLLMRLLDATGQRTAALRQFELCREILSRELGVEPERETVALYETIRKSGRDPPPADPPSAAKDAEKRQPPSPPSEPSTVEPSPRVPRERASGPSQGLVASPPFGGAVAPLKPSTETVGLTSGSPNLERRLAAVMSADVAGFSRMMGADENGTLQRLKAHRAELIEPTIAEHRGRIVKLMGDGMLVEFASVVDAVAASVAIQRGLANRNAGVAPDKRFEFRIGINIGDVMVEGDDIYGDGVNVAARLQEAAEPGSVYVSDDVFRQLRGKLDLSLDYRGRHELKNISDAVPVWRWAGENLERRLSWATVRELSKRRGKIGKTLAARRRLWVASALFALVIVGGGVYWGGYLRAPLPGFEPARPENMAWPLPEKPSIAILPFANQTGDATQDLLVDGITEEITTALSIVSGMFVIARSSTLAYRGKEVEAKLVAEQLGVRYVVQGSVSRSGETLRIHAYLNDAIKGNQLWAKRYEPKVKDIFALQDDIARNIIVEVQVKLTEGEQERVSLVHGTTNLEAWIDATEALDLLRRLNKQDNAKARDLYTKASQIDQKFPAAWDGIAWTHVVDVRFGWSGSPMDSLRQAAEFAQKSQMLDPTRANSYGLLGTIALFSSHCDQAVALSEKAVALEPNGADMTAILGLIMTYCGDPTRAAASLEQAMRLAPSYPDWYRWALGRAYRQLDRHDDAINALSHGLEALPDALAPRVELAAAYSETNQLAKARAAAEAVLKINPRFSVLSWVAAPHHKDDAITVREIAALRRAGLPD